MVAGIGVVNDEAGYIFLLGGQNKPIKERRLSGDQCFQACIGARGGSETWDDEKYGSTYYGRKKRSTDPAGRLRPTKDICGEWDARTVPCANLQRVGRRFRSGPAGVVVARCG